MVSCDRCGKQIWRKAKELSTNHHFFCSHNCRNQFKKNKVQFQSSAHWAVFAAIKKGLLIRPSRCERCGKTCKPDAHHDDHRNALNVKWLCRKCHIAISPQIIAAVIARHRKWFSPCPCGKKATTRGLCPSCYARERPRLLNKPQCLVPGCANRQGSRGLCENHRRSKKWVHLKLPCRALA